MSDHDQKVEPLRFEPASPASVEPDTAPVRRGRFSGVPVAAVVLGVLGLLAIVVFLWLPRQVDREAVRAAVVEELPTPAPAAREEISPWSDAQVAIQREEARDVLALLLEEQALLEDLQVERWAAEDFNAALEHAQSGDEFYRQSRFAEAAADYKAGLDAMTAIGESIDAIFAEYLASGEEHLAADRAEPAVAALEMAVVLRPDSDEASAALERARALPALLDLLFRARAAVEANDLDTARGLLEQAHALDPKHAGAEEQLRSVRQSITQRNFNRAMTAGYQALEEKRYDEAERQFLRAQKILPAAPEADSAVLQARTERTQAQIDSHADVARGAESREQWNDAGEAYQAILDIDNSVIFARTGLIQARTRAALDSRLVAAIGKPERLRDDAVYSETQALYRQALALERKGPRLRGQLEELHGLLERAVVPIPILLRSDEQTEVTVLTVARLGAFSRRQLELKPGTYTAVGAREGYRDVRLEFTVSPDRANAVVEVACTEPI